MHARADVQIGRHQYLEHHYRHDRIDSRNHRLKKQNGMEKHTPLKMYFSARSHLTERTNSNVTTAEVKDSRRRLRRRVYVISTFMTSSGFTPETTSATDSLRSAVVSAVHVSLALLAYVVIDTLTCILVKKEEIMSRAMWYGITAACLLTHLVVSLVVGPRLSCG